MFQTSNVHQIRRLLKDISLGSPQCGGFTTENSLQLWPYWPGILGVAVSSQLGLGVTAEAGN